MKALFISLILVLGASAVAQAHAAELSANCLTSETARELGRSFSTFSPYVGLPVCAQSDPGIYHVGEALSAMKSMSFKSNRKSGDDLVRGLIPADWYKHFASEVERFIDATSERTCRNGTLAFVRMDSPRTVWYCPEFGADDLTVFDRMVHLLHEAHHLHTKIQHVHCRRGAYAGQAAKVCDDSPGERGAYSATVEAYAKIASQASQLHPVARDSARWMAFSHAADSFNVPLRVARKEALALLTERGEVRIFDGTRWSDKPVTAQPGLLVSRTGLGFVNYPSEPTLGPTAFTSNFSGSMALKLSGGFAAKYNSLSTEERREFRGAFHLERMGIWLDSRRVLVDCMGRKEIQEWKLPDSDKLGSDKDEIKGPLHRSGLRAEQEEAEILLRSGRVFKVQCSHRGEAQITDLNEIWDGPSKVVRLNKALYGLTSDGQLVTQVGANWVPVDATSRQRFGDMTAYDWVHLFEDAAGEAARR